MTVSDWMAVLTVTDEAVDAPEPLVIADRFRAASAVPLSLSVVNRAPLLPTAMLIDPPENAVEAEEAEDSEIAVVTFVTAAELAALVPLAAPLMGARLSAASSPLVVAPESLISVMNGVPAPRSMVKTPAA